MNPQNFQQVKEEWQNPEDPPSNAFNMRIVVLQNLCNYYATERAPSRSLYNSLQKNKSYLISKPDDALDAVRAVFQKSLNKEIDAIIQKFSKRYLLPAIANIQGNGYDVSANDIHGVYHRILEEAKKIYPIGGGLIGENETATPTSSSTTVDRVGTPSTISMPTKIVNRHIPAGLRKRKEAADSDTESDISQVSTSYRKKAKQETAATTPKRGAAAAQTQSNTFLKTMDIPFEDAEKWNPDRVDVNTVFVLGSKANSALGLSAQRGRIYIKHPGLFRYIGDHEDKMWLFENKQKTVKFGGKAFLVVLDDIVQLAETPEYRSNPDVQLDNLNGFTLPQFIIDKMRSKMEPVYDNLRVRYGLPASGETTTRGQLNVNESIAESAQFVPVAEASPAATSEGGSDQ